MNNLEFISKNKIFAVIRTATSELAHTAAKAVIAGGIKLVEITMTVPDAYQVIKQLAAAEEDVWVGAGSVVSVEQAEKALAAGAKFIVSPICEPKVIKLAQERKILIAAGGLTPTEIWQAQELGADLVKVFPAEAVGGPNYLRYLRGPMPSLKILASGGVTPKNMIPYLQSGAFAVGLAASLIDPLALEKNQIDKITHTARILVKSLQSYLWLKGSG